MSKGTQAEPRISLGFLMVVRFDLLECKNSKKVLVG